MTTMKPRKNSNYDTISHKTVAAETMTFMSADNVSSILYNVSQMY